LDGFGQHGEDQQQGQQMRLCWELQFVVVSIGGEGTGLLVDSGCPNVGPGESRPCV
jgi:hypothetical protein